MVFAVDHGAHVGAPHRIFGLCVFCKYSHAVWCAGFEISQPVLLVIGGPVIMLQTFCAVLVNLPHPLNHSHRSHCPGVTLLMFGTGLSIGSGLYLRFQVDDCASFCCSLVESRSCFNIAYTAPSMVGLLVALGLLGLLATGFCAKCPLEMRKIFLVGDSGSFSFDNKLCVLLLVLFVLCVLCCCCCSCMFVGLGWVGNDIGIPDIPLACGGMWGSGSGSTCSDVVVVLM